MRCVITIPVEFDRYCVSTTYAKMLADMVCVRGFALDELLRGTGIDEAALQRVEDRVPAQGMLRLIRNALQLTQEPALGLLFGFQLKLSAHGFLGYAALSSETLGDALVLAVKYFKIRFGLLDVQLRMFEDVALLDVEPTLPLYEAEPFIMEAFMAGFAVMALNLLGQIPSEISTSWRMVRPQHGSGWLQYLPEGQVRYGANANQIRIPIRLLSQKLGLSDPNSRKLAEEQCKRELSMLEENESIIARVRHIIISEGQRFPKLDVVAEKCFMSGRTFKRRLQQLGTSFQEILDDIRKDQAIDYLRHTNKPIDEIAALLGYNDPSNFGRAFKRWTGKTPSQYRHQQEILSA
ncbi:Transcriptional regulator, AraC family [gamma proteobacterium HdN1]|nr:Transcriptional regulator, AraC family [gamma proteobacterium HdN1]